MYDVGYSDRKAFGTIFNKLVGMTPSNYKMKFSADK
jgi:YesN/AraC family two-component response regulator